MLEMLYLVTAVEAEPMDDPKVGVPRCITEEEFATLFWPNLTLSESVPSDSPRGRLVAEGVEVKDGATINIFVSPDGLSRVAAIWYGRCVDIETGPFDVGD